MTTREYRVQRGDGTTQVVRRTAEQQRAYSRARDARLRARMVALKMERGGACEKCGYDRCLAALEWAHRDGEEKGYDIARFRSVKEETVRAEIAKCDLLCANCHREQHHPHESCKLLVGS